MKRLKIIAGFVALCMVFSSACGETSSELPSDGKVEMDLTLMNEYAHENIFEISPTSSGLKMEGIQDIKAACSKMRFPIENGEKLSCTFALPVYEEDSEDFLVTGVNMHTKTCVDLLLRGQTQAEPVAQLRLWAEASPDAVCVSCRITWRLNGESATYDSYFDAEAARFPYADGKKVTGNMRESKPFTIVFDKENLFQSYIGGDTTELVPLLDETKESDKAVIDGMKKAFSDVRSVSLIFRFLGKTREDLENSGFHGFEASSCFVLKELNGQSLCTENGRVKDDVSPYISPPEIVAGTQLSAYRDYVYEVKTNEADEPGRTTVLYSSFATDVLSWKNMEYSLLFTLPDGSEKRTEDLKYSTGAAGEYTVRAIVRDESGNEYISAARTFTVVDTYRINVEGEIPKTAKRGAVFKVPDAYVTNAEGKTADSSGKPYSYTLSVRDPVEMDVEIGADGNLTFGRKGIYTIVYRSVSEDGEDTLTFRITVS